MQPCVCHHHQSAVLLLAAAAHSAQFCWEGTAADRADWGLAAAYCCCWGWGAVGAGLEHAAAGVPAAAAGVLAVEAACIRVSQQKEQAW